MGILFTLTLILAAILAYKILIGTLHSKPNPELKRNAILNQHTDHQKNAKSSDTHLTIIDLEQIAIEFTDKHRFQLNKNLKDNDKADDLIDKMLGETFAMSYRNAEGDRTERKITINNVFFYGKNAYIEAYCHLRQEDREFKVSRILGSLKNVNTGEEIYPKELQ